MADMLTIGSLASGAYKKAIEVTSHNVANVGTDGYHRQRAEIVSNNPQINGTGFLGGGAQVQTVNRIYADYLQNQLIASNATNQRYDQQLKLSKQVEGIVASNDQGIQQFMQRFYDAMQNLSNDPTTNTNRRLLLDETGNLESHISNLASILKDTQQQTNKQIEDTVTSINQQLDTIYTINKQVERALASGSQPPNDLLDRREKAIKDLSTYIDIKPFRQKNGRVDIHTADGRLPLISDNTLTKLVAKRSDFPNESRTEVFMNISGESKKISDFIHGGQLGGVLDFRKNMLDKAQDELGVTLNGLVASTNWQHYQGWDLNGNAGDNFFAPLATNAMKNIHNTGAEDGTNIKVSFDPNFASANPQPPYLPPSSQPATYGAKQTDFKNALTEIGHFTAREYELKYRAGTNDFAFYDHQTGQPVLDNTGTQITVANGAQANVEGLKFDFRNTSALSDGDSFVVKPHQDILQQFKKSLQDPNKIATRGQSPVDTNNNGSLLDEVPAAAAYGDNVNMANMASLASKKLLYSDTAGNPSETLLGGYSKMSVNVGLYVSGTDIQHQAQTNVLQQVTNRIESLSGVNLDEEAANLLKYQQAYQASAQIIQAAQKMFTTMMGALRG